MRRDVTVKRITEARQNVITAHSSAMSSVHCAAAELVYRCSQIAYFNHSSVYFTLGGGRTLKLMTYICRAEAATTPFKFSMQASEERLKRAQNGQRSDLFLCIHKNVHTETRARQNYGAARQNPRKLLTYCIYKGMTKRKISDTVFQYVQHVRHARH